VAWRPSSIGVAFSFFATLPCGLGEGNSAGCLSLQSLRGTVGIDQRVRKTSAVTRCEVRRETASQSEAQPPLEFVCGRLCPTVAVAHLSLLLLLPFLPAHLSALPLCSSSPPPLPQGPPQLLSPTSLVTVSELYFSIFPLPVHHL
jgi:hypothetical protein